MFAARIVDDNLTVADLHSRAFRRVEIMLDIDASSDSTVQYHKLKGESLSRRYESIKRPSGPPTTSTT